MADSVEATTFADDDFRYKLCYNFGAWDYVVFALLLIISTLIGVFFAIRSRNNADDSDDYLLGGRQMSALPVSLSLTASFMSAITVLGTPSEFYIYGTMFWWFALSYTLTAIIVSEIYIPLFYRLRITSTYEYLEMRFSKPVRILATTMYILNTILYVGIVIYAPALALNEVTGLSIWGSVLVTATVCTFYTTLGGLKAVIWTDVFQCLIMWIGFVAILIKGCAVLGGFDNVWQTASERGRIQYNHFEFDPKIRHTFWSISVGGTILWTATYGTTQTMVQRYVSCKTENQAKIALFFNVIGLYIVLLLTGFSGLVMFAYYADCDPYTEGWVGATDQLMPYFVLELLHDYPGLPGIYVCSAFSGTLSTVSSGINAMATVTIEDYILPVKNLSQRKSVILSKILVAVYGLACTAMAALASQLGGVLQAALSINGIVGGPMLGLFTLGGLLPWCNSIGAFIGLVCGLGCSTWVYVGSTFYPPSDEYKGVLPLSTSSCSNIPDEESCGPTENISISTTQAVMSTTPVPTTTDRPPIADFYSMSYLYYSAIGFAVTVVTGLLVSFATGYQHPSELPPGTVFPIFDHFIFRWIPSSIRRKLWCGVRHDETSEISFESKHEKSSSPYHIAGDSTYKSFNDFNLLDPDRNDLSSEIESNVKSIAEPDQYNTNLPREFGVVLAPSSMIDSGVDNFSNNIDEYDASNMLSTKL